MAVQMFFRVNDASIAFLGAACYNGRKGDDPHERQTIRRVSRTVQT